LLLAGIGLNVALQVYSAYDKMVIPDVSTVSTLGTPSGVIWVIERSTFVGPPSLANHLRGAVFWACLLLVPLSLSGSSLDRRAGITFMMTVFAILVVTRLVL
jgi:hypothetical protein